MLSRLRRTDDGLALTVVLDTAAVLTLLVLLSLEVTVRGVQRARQDQSYLDAMPAAQAGVEDYLHPLNRDNNYFNKENTIPQIRRSPAGFTCRACRRMQRFATG